MNHRRSHTIVASVATIAALTLGACSSDKANSTSGDQSAATETNPPTGDTSEFGDGTDHTLMESPSIFGRQMLRNLIGLGQDLAGLARPVWSLGGARQGRDLGYPGGRQRPAVYDPRAHLREHEKERGEQR